MARRSFMVGLMLATVVTALLWGLKPSAALAAPQQPHRSICYQAHVQNIGWQDVVCNGALAGTTGQSLRLEALNLFPRGVGLLCVNAHVQNIGDQGLRCARDGQVVMVGTTGMSLRMEGLFISVQRGRVCAEAHVQNIGWQPWQCGRAIFVGTKGMSLRMEAIRIIV
jgi:uncharacterized protein YjdB